MKVWKVDNYCVGDVRLCRDELQDGSFGPEYWRTPQMDLEDILNALERQGACIKEIISYSEGNYSIVYTVEEDLESEFLS